MLLSHFSHTSHSHSLHTKSQSLTHWLSLSLSLSHKHTHLDFLDVQLTTTTHSSLKFSHTHLSLSFSLTLSLTQSHTHTIYVSHILSHSQSLVSLFAQTLLYLTLNTPSLTPFQHSLSHNLNTLSHNFISHYLRTLLSHSLYNSLSHTYTIYSLIIYIILSLSLT